MKNGDFTFVILKPDCVERGLVGAVLGRFEALRLDISTVRIVTHADPRVVRAHYAEHAERDFFPAICDAMLEGPLWVLILTGPDAQARARAEAGPAVDPPPGTIRGDLRLDQVRNTVHTSSSVDDAYREVELWHRPRTFLYPLGG